MFAIPGLNAFVSGVNNGRNRQLQLLTNALQLLDQGLEREQRVAQQQRRADFERAVVDETGRAGSIEQALINIGTTDPDIGFRQEALTTLNQFNDALLPTAQRQAAQGNLGGSAALSFFNQGGGRTPASAGEAFSFLNPAPNIRNNIQQNNRLQQVTGQALGLGNSNLGTSRINGLNASVVAQQQDAAGFGTSGVFNPTQQLAGRVRNALTPPQANQQLFGPLDDFFGGGF
jgi:hypothetical protein